MRAQVQTSCLTPFWLQDLADAGVRLLTLMLRENPSRLGPYTPAEPVMGVLLELMAHADTMQQVRDWQY